MKRQATLDTAHKLESLLEEPVAHARERERSAFSDELKRSFGRVVIYGAGNLGKRILAGLRESGPEVRAFADRNPALWSQTVDGVRVYRPEEAASTFGDTDLFLAAVCHPTQIGGVDLVLQDLRELGCRHVTSFVPLFWRDANRYLPYYMWDLPSRLLESADRVRAGFRLFDGDIDSQSWFVQQVRLRLQGTFNGLDAPAPHDQYFPNLFRALPHECFVDCGAFDGDSIQAFLNWTNGSFSKIIAFEPDPKNAAALRRFTQSQPSLSERLEVKTSAVGDRSGVRRFVASGAGNAALSPAGDIQVPCTTLDEELGAQSITFIKMDIEGEEIAALEGARNVIRRDRPVLAICAYHLQNHLWEVPLYMSGLQERARLALIGYAMDGFDTVCYSIPDERPR